MLRRVALVRNYVSEEFSASFIRVRMGELTKEAQSSSETSVLTRATLSDIPEDAILQWRAVFSVVTAFQCWNDINAWFVCSDGSSRRTKLCRYAELRCILRCRLLRGTVIFFFTDDKSSISLSAETCYLIREIFMAAGSRAERRKASSLHLHLPPPPSTPSHLPTPPPPSPPPSPSPFLCT
jgi:hypothetical protein